MRITRSAKLAAGLAATLAIFTATLPSTAATTDPVAVAAQPVAGSSNVRIDGSRIILGDAPAAVGSTEIKQRSGLAELTPVRLTTFALRNVLRHRRRSLLTVVIIWFCFVALSLFQGYIQSSKESWGEILIRNEFGHLQVFREGYLEDDETSFDHMIGPADASKVLELLRQDPRVQFAAPRVKLSGLVGNGKTSRVFVVDRPTESVAVVVIR